MKSKMAGKRIIFAAVLTVFLFLNGGSVSRAYLVEVDSDNTNVRETASTDGNVVTVVNSGDQFDVQSEETGSDGKTWYQISVNNQTGYVRSDLVSEASAESAGQQQTAAASSSSVTSITSQSATVKGNSVNVRSSASTSGSVVATVKDGDAVTLTGTATDSSGNTWYQVNFISNGSDVTGFIREDMVEPGEAVEEASGQESAEGEDDLADLYGDMPAEEESVSNDTYELVYTADQEGVDCWYVNDYSSGKRYKLEQLLEAEEIAASNMEIMNQKVSRMRIAVIVLAVLFVAALVAAGVFGFKFRELSEEDDEDDEDDDFREAPPVRRRAQGAQAPERRTRPVPARNDAGAQSSDRQPQRRPVSAAGAQRRAPQSEQRRSAGEEGPAVKKAPQRRPEAAVKRKPDSSGMENGDVQRRNSSSGEQARRAPRPEEKKSASKSARPDVEWKSKNFLSGDEDGLDFSFLDMKDDE